MTRRLRALLFATVVLVTAGLATHGTYAGTGDEAHYLAIAHSIAFDGDLDLSNNYGAAEPLIAGGGSQPEAHVRPGTGGVLRPVHDIGMPLLFAPYVRVMRPLAAWAAERLPSTLMERWRLNPSVLYRHTITAGMIVVAGMLALVMFDVFIRIDIGERQAFWVTLLVALSPPLLVFSILFFTELLSALLCLWLLRKASFDLGEAVWTWAVAGAATGFLVLIHIRNISIAMTLAAIALAVPGQRDARAKRIAFATALGVMLVARTIVIHHMWGTWMTTPIANVGKANGIWSALTIAAGRLGGLLLDQEYGLLPYAPIFLVAVFGFVTLARTHPGLARRAGIVAGCYVISLILPITNAVGVAGGWSPVARFLVPIVPLLAIGVAAGVRTAPRALVLPLVALQIVINAYVWQHPKILWNNGTGTAAMCSHIGDRICAYLPSFVGIH